MKVLLLAKHLNTGGITSYLYLLSKGLIEKGCCITIVSSGGDREKEFEDLGVNVCNIDLMFKSIINFKILKVYQWLKRFLQEESFDIIHAQTRVTQCLAEKLSKKFNIPYVVTCHGFFTMNLARKFFPCWGDRVIAISASVQKHLQCDLEVCPSKIQLVRNGINLSSYENISEAERNQSKEKYGVSGFKTVGIIARLSDVKGHKFLIDAMAIVKAEIKDVISLIVGDGPLELQLKQQVQELGLEKDILFFKVINNPREMLSLFDIFVLPSLHEGLGLSVMEAQTCGLPVIASHVGGLVDLIEHDKTGVLVKSKDAQAIAIAIKRLLKQPDFMTLLGINAREKALNSYCYKSMSDKTLSIYESVCLPANFS